MDQKERNSVHLFCPFYWTNLEIRRISHGETNTSKVDNGAEFPFKFLLLIWSRTWLFAAFCFLLCRTPITETHPAQKPQASNKNTLSCTAPRSQGPKREREDKAARDLCSHLLCGCLRRYFSPGHWHCVQKSAKKNIPASQRAPVPPQCVRNKKKFMLYHIFSTSLELSKEQGTWKQLFIESTADSRRSGWEGQHEIHKLHFFPDLVL